VAIAYRLPDEPLPKLTRELKRWTFPPPCLPCWCRSPRGRGYGGAGGTSGRGRSTRPWPFATLLVNGWAFAVEIRNVASTPELIQDVMREVDRLRALQRACPSNEEALRQEREG